MLPSYYALLCFKILVSKFTISAELTFKIVAYNHNSRKKTVGNIEMNVKTKIYEYPHKSSATHIFHLSFLLNTIATWKKSR